MSKRVLAIDLGTTNSLCSDFNENSNTGETIVSKDGGYMIPSVVYFDSDGKYIVGTLAKESAVLDPDRTISNVKRLMGVENVAIIVDGTPYSPQQISALILKEVVESAEEYLEEKITDIVITVPAYYKSDAKEATKEAAKIADLNVLDLIEEPIAALYHCDNISDLRGMHVIIFDFGGGTLDICCVYIGENEINEIAITGDNGLGGIDFDRALLNYIKEKYLQGRTLDPDDEQALLLSVEKAKIALSRKEKTRVTISTREGRMMVEITREEFVNCTKHLMDRVKAKLSEIMLDLSENGVEPDKVIMVGGTTRMPQVEACVRNVFPAADIIAKDQDEAVCRGAAVYAKLLSDDKNNKLSIKKSYKVKKLNRISGRSYGLAAFLGEGGDLKICNMIYRSQDLPITKKKDFYSTLENQKKISLKVYENTSSERYLDINEDWLLGKCTLEIDEDLKKGSLIEVTFTLNEQGILTLEGKEPQSGKAVRTIMESKALLEPEELLTQKGQIDKLQRME